MKPVVINLDSPAVMAALDDWTTMRRWEVLRRSPLPLSAPELAEACHCRLADMQRSLDLLIAAGLVVRLRVTSKRRFVSYQVVGQELIVKFDSQNPAQLEWMGQQRVKLRRFGRDLVDRYFQKADHLGRQTFSTELCGVLELDDEETQQVNSVLQQALRSILEINRKAQERTRRHADGEPAAAAPPSPLRPHVIAMSFGTLGNEELPLARVSILDARFVEQRVASIASNPKALLTQRELGIASRLASGRSRPEVAKELAVSANTIASTTKRIYSKLGVRNRAEFAARMAAHPTP